MIAGISHDLSTPLTSIKGYVSGLLDGVANTPEKQTHYLQTIYRTACDMDQLVDSLFLFSKLDMGSIQFHFETVELKGYFQDYCEETAPRLELQDTSISFQCAPGIYLASLDRMQFGRVVSNLVENSIKYKRSQVPCQIMITLEKRPTISICESVLLTMGVEFIPKTPQKYLTAFIARTQHAAKPLKAAAWGWPLPSKLLRN